MQFKPSDRTVSKYSSANMKKFLNRIMQLEGEDDDEEEEEHSDPLKTT